MTSPDRSAPGTPSTLPLLAGFLDEHRELLAASLDGLTEEEARRRLGPSRTTLLGLLAHATFVERVWFEEARTGTPRREMGLPEDSGDSFVPGEEDTIASVRAAFHAACERSRAVLDASEEDEVWSGNRRGPLPLR